MKRTLTLLAAVAVASFLSAGDSLAKGNRGQMRDPAAQTCQRPANSPATARGGQGASGRQACRNASCRSDTANQQGQAQGRGAGGQMGKNSGRNAAQGKGPGGGQGSVD